jgi:hypothetical protein
MLKKSVSMFAAFLLVVQFASAQMMNSEKGQEGQTVMPYMGMMGSGMMSPGMMGQGMMGQPMMNPSQMGGYMWGSQITALLNMNLNDNQIDRLIDLHASLFKEQVPLLRERLNLISEIESLRRSESPDIKQLQTRMTDLGRVNGDLESNFLVSRQKALATLTPEQREKLDGQGLPMFSGPGGMAGMGYGMMGHGWNAANQQKKIHHDEMMQGNYRGAN